VRDIVYISVRVWKNKKKKKKERKKKKLVPDLGSVMAI